MMSPRVISNSFVSSTLQTSLRPLGVTVQENKVPKKLYHHLNAKDQLAEKLRTQWIYAQRLPYQPSNIDVRLHRIIEGLPANPVRTSFSDILLGLCPVSKSKTNHILLYTGAFNPPTKSDIGFLQVITQAAISHADMNVIGVLVLPHADHVLTDKARQRPTPNQLSWSYRTCLWREDKARPAWATVYQPKEGPELELDDFIREMREAKFNASLEGCKVEIAGIVKHEKDTIETLNPEFGANCVLDSLLFGSYCMPPWEACRGKYDLHHSSLKEWAPVRGNIGDSLQAWRTEFAAGTSETQPIRALRFIQMSSSVPAVADENPFCIFSHARF